MAVLCVELFSAMRRRGCRRVDGLSDHVLIIGVALSGTSGAVLFVWASVGLVAIHDPASEAD